MADDARDVRVGHRVCAYLYAFVHAASVGRPIRRKKVAWRSSWSSACVAPIDAPDPRSAFTRPRSVDRVRLSSVGDHQSLASAAHSRAAIVHFWPDWRDDDHSLLPLEVW